MRRRKRKRRCCSTSLIFLKSILSQSPSATSLPSFHFHSHFLFFSTKINPNPNPFNPKPNFPYSSNPSHARIQKSLLEKSKTGFDKLDDALVVFDKMLQMKPLLPVINFTQLLSALVKMKQYSVAVSLLRDMCVFLVPVDIFTFSTVINCCCHLNRIDYAFSLLTGILKRGLVPSVVTYTTLIISQDKVVDTHHLLKKLIISKEIQPDVVIYNTLIRGLISQNKAVDAVHLIQSKGIEYSYVRHHYSEEGY